MDEVSLKSHIKKTVLKNLLQGKAAKRQPTTFNINLELNVSDGDTNNIVQEDIKICILDRIRSAIEQSDIPKKH